MSLAAVAEPVRASAAQPAPPAPKPAAPAAPVASSAAPAAQPPAAANEASLSLELKNKLQGTMALVLKHSGAFGKASGPLEGKELELMKGALRDVSSALRKETEDVYDQPIESLASAQPQQQPQQQPVAEQSAATAPARPAQQVAPSSYADMLAQARARKAAQQRG